jgi:flagellar basal-body rod protein FlgG
MANVNTTSYKKGIIHFQDMFYEKLRAAGAANQGDVGTTGIQLGTGVKIASASKLFSQGTLKHTTSDLDFAIEGNGFFEVSLPNGDTAYTRDGNFHLDSNGKIVTSDGYEVLNFPKIDPKASSINVMPDGTVTSYVKKTGQPAQNIVNGQIKLTNFINAEGLNYLGRNLYSESELSGSPSTGTPGNDEFGSVIQRCLEDSNVDMVREMVDLISAQRAYELNSKTIKTADSMMQLVAQLKN